MSPSDRPDQERPGSAGVDQPAVYTESNRQAEDLPVFLDELPPGAPIPKHFNMGSFEQLRYRREEAERQARCAQEDPPGDRSS